MAQLSALADRHLDEMETRDVHYAQICALLAEPHRDRKRLGTAYKVSDFYVIEHRDGAGKKSTVVPPDVLESRLRMTMTALGGEEIKPDGK